MIENYQYFYAPQGEAGNQMQGASISQIQTVVPFNYKYLMIAFLIIKYFWEQYINFRQLRRNLTVVMPPELQNYNISVNQFLKNQSYSFDKITFQMLALSIRAAADTLTIMCNLLPFIWENVHNIFPFISMESEFQRAVGYTLIQAFKSKAFEVPISAYQTFVIEKKYNFTNKTLELFIYDLFVQAALMIIIFPPIIYGYLQVVQVGGEYFYLFLQVFVICITIVLTWIHPNLIAPLFNKFAKLDDNQLRMKIFTIANKSSIKLSNIYVINSSVRSAHSNAYLYGLGRTKTIVLYDSLLKSLTRQQTVAVICHEMGHSKYSHSLKRMIIYLIQVFSMFYIFAQFIKNQNVFTSFGFSTRSVFICTALYFHMFQPLTSVFDTLLLVLTRKFQFQADMFACQVGYGPQLKNGLIKLFKQSTSTVKPDILYAWIKHSHPSIHERVQAIDAAMKKNKKKCDDAERQKNKSKYIISNDSRIKPNVISHKKSASTLGNKPAFKIQTQQQKNKDKIIEDYSSDEQEYSFSSSSYSNSSHYSLYSESSLNKYN